MSDPLRDLVDSMVRLSAQLDSALTHLKQRGEALAGKERDYRKARAVAWLETEGTAKQREDSVNAKTADERFERDLAQHAREAAQEAVRSYRTQLSVLQTIANAEREDRALSRTGPDAA